MRVESMQAFRDLRLGRFVVLAVGVGDEEGRVIVVQRVLAVRQTLRVMEHRVARTPGLVGRAHQPLAAFFGDAGDPHRMGDDRPRIVGGAGGLGAHHIERR